MVIMILLLERRGGFTPRKLSGTGSVKERERDFAEPGSAGPPPPPRAPAAGAEFLLRGCAVASRPRPVRVACGRCAQEVVKTQGQLVTFGPGRLGPARRIVSRA